MSKRTIKSVEKKILLAIIFVALLVFDEFCCKEETYIGQGLPELTPVEIVGYEVNEAGSPLALDNG